MTRSHRRWHAWLWLVLGPVLVAGFVAALAARPAPIAQPAPAAVQGRADNADRNPTQREVSP
jgi:hypothetical protein